MSRVMCKRCSETLRRSAPLCGWCIEELTRAAISSLTSRRVRARIEAIDFLREQGCTAEAVIEAREEVRRGVEVEKIAQRLEGREEPIAA